MTRLILIVALTISACAGGRDLVLVIPPSAASGDCECEWYGCLFWDLGQQAIMPVPVRHGDILTSASVYVDEQGGGPIDASLWSVSSVGDPVLLAEGRSAGWGGDVSIALADIDYRLDGEEAISLRVAGSTIDIGGGQRLMLAEIAITE